MKFKKLPIEGAYIIELDSVRDTRGVFTRIFSIDEIKRLDPNFSITQINQSRSSHKGTIRGLHMQEKPREEAKIMQCIAGRAFDVIIDLRKKSKTYGKWHGTTISEKENNLIFVPRGCAHGFQALEPETIVQYPVSEFYSPLHELGVRWNDPSFNIGWPISRIRVSKKDASWKDINL